MKLIETMPPEAAETFRRIAGSDANVRISVATDMTMDGRYGEQWLVATDERLLVLSHDGVPETITFPQKEIKSVKAEVLVSGGRLEVVRVVEEILTEQEPIPFESAWQPDPDLEIDHQRLAQEGAVGVLQRRILVRYENGEEVSRVVEDEWVAQEPTTHIHAYGTKIVAHQLDTADGPIEYWRTIRVLATSYTAATSGKERDHPAYGITAVGWAMRTGIIAVDPRVINLYQDLYVPGYGFGVAADTGGAVKGRRIDLGYDEENLVLWYSWVDVYLLTPAPDPSKIRYTIGD